MGIAVRAMPVETRQVPAKPMQIESFFWGMVAGGVVMVVVGGVVLYFAWPLVGAGLKTLGLMQLVGGGY